MHLKNVWTLHLWATIRDLIHGAALETLGPTTRKHKDWFDDNCTEIKELLAKKHRLHKDWLSNPGSISKKDAFNSVCSTIQQKLRQMQDSWLSSEADEIQGYADSHNAKKFYEALKAVYGPTSSGSSPLLGTDGTTLITEKDKILERWADTSAAS